MTEEGTTTTTTEGGDNGAAARIRQLVARVKELEGRVGELTPLAENAEKYRAQVEEVKATSKAEREALRMEREIAAAGITDAEGIEYVQHAYGRLPSEGRPPLAEWLAAKDALPKAVRAYLPEAAPPAPAPTGPTPQALPKSNAGTVTQTPPATTTWTPEAIMRLTPAEYKANAAAIQAALRTP
jgi:DNA repair exonuclease SbcCD ATPase subunit